MINQHIADKFGIRQAERYLICYGNSPLEWWRGADPDTASEEIAPAIRPGPEAGIRFEGAGPHLLIMLEIRTCYPLKTKNCIIKKELYN